MNRQNEQKLTVCPDFGRDILDKPFLTIGEVASLLQGGEGQDHPLVAKYVQSEQAYPEYFCRCSTRQARYSGEP